MKANTDGTAPLICHGASGSYGGNLAAKNIVTVTDARIHNGSAVSGGASLEEVVVSYLAKLTGMNMDSVKEWMPEDFAPFSSVSLICPGVLGTTGIESANIVKGVVDAVKPDAVIAVDALAASAADRLCRTVQICDTGIEPGSGVGNRRFALNRETLGVPVISIGVPTVVDADTFIYSIAEDTAPKHSRGEGMFITPREIDSFVAHSGKLLGYGINFALHDDLTLGDIDMFVG